MINERAGTSNSDRLRQMRMERERILNEIATVAFEIGFSDAPGEVSRLADALDEKGYRTAQGQAWITHRGANLRHYIRHYFPGLTGEIQKLKFFAGNSSEAMESEMKAIGDDFIAKCRECVATCEKISAEVKFLLEQAFREDPELQLYPIDEVANLLKVNRATVERLLKEGELEYQVVLSRKRISKKALEEYYVRHTFRKAQGKPLYARGVEQGGPLRRNRGRPQKIGHTRSSR